MHRGHCRRGGGQCGGLYAHERAYAQFVLWVIQPASVLCDLELGRFLQTTVVPVAVLVLVTLVGLLRKMGHTPLQFLRHETSKGGVKRGFALPERLGFTARFRLRVFLRNLGNFATLFVGIGFASLLLLFSLAILPTMSHYAENLHNTVVAQHQYSLKAPLGLRAPVTSAKHGKPPIRCRVWRAPGFRLLKTLPTMLKKG